MKSRENKPAEVIKHSKPIPIPNENEIAKASPSSFYVGSPLRQANFLFKSPSQKPAQDFKQLISAEEFGKRRDKVEKRLFLHSSSLSLEEETLSAEENSRLLL